MVCLLRPAIVKITVKTPKDVATYLTFSIDNIRNSSRAISSAFRPPSFLQGWFPSSRTRGNDPSFPGTRGIPPSQSTGKGQTYDEDGVAHDVSTQAWRVAAKQISCLDLFTLPSASTTPNTPLEYRQVSTPHDKPVVSPPLRHHPSHRL